MLILQTDIIACNSNIREKVKVIYQ